MQCVVAAEIGHSKIVNLHFLKGTENYRTNSHMVEPKKKKDVCAEPKDLISIKTQVALRPKLKTLLISTAGL